MAHEIELINSLKKSCQSRRGDQGYIKENMNKKSLFVNQEHVHI